MGLTVHHVPSAGGVYEIIDSHGERYVGSTADLNRRWRGHIYSLRAGKHHSRTLQRVYGEEGEASLKFHVLEYVDDESRLISTEQKWFERLNTTHNVAKHAGRSVTRRNSDRSHPEPGRHPANMSVANITAGKLLDRARMIRLEAIASGDEHLSAAAWLLAELVRVKRDDYLYLSRLEDSHVWTQLRMFDKKRAV